MKNYRTIRLVGTITLLIIFIVFIAYFTKEYAYEITKLIKNPEDFRNYLVSYGPASILVFICFQILQVVIAVIPGEFVQIAGGYVYGTIAGTLYSVIGIFSGSVIAFYISRLLGYSLIELLIPQSKIQKFMKFINSPKSELAIFILFLIPGTPKDILAYIVGLTPIKPMSFFIIMLVARFPSLLGSSFIGANIYEKNYLPVIILSVFTIAVFILGLLSKEKILAKISMYKQVKD